MVIKKFMNIAIEVSSFCCLLDMMLALASITIIVFAIFC